MDTARQANGITRSPCGRPTKFPTNNHQPPAIGASTAILQGALKAKRIKSLGPNLTRYELIIRVWRSL